MIRFTLAILLFVFSDPSAIAQLQKGDLLIGFNTVVNNTKSNQVLGLWDTATSYRLSPTIGYMVSPKVMAGGSIELSFSKNTSFGYDQSYRKINVNPFLRYYFYKRKRLNVYGFLYGHLSNSLRKAENEKNIRTGWRPSVAGGIGAHFFLASNLALQSDIGTSLFQNKSRSGYSSVVFFDIGFKTFFNDRSFFKENIQSKYMKKGNAVISGSGRFNIYGNANYQYDDTGDIYTGLQVIAYSANPNLKYFINDRMAIQFSIPISGYHTKNFTYTGSGVSIGAERYMPLGKQTFFVPAISLKAENIRQKYNIVQIVTDPLTGRPTLNTSQQKDNIYLAEGELHLGFKYFTKKVSVFSWGGIYSFFRNVTDKNSFYQPINKLDFYLKHEYFLFRNLSLTTNLTYSIRESNRFNHYRLFSLPSDPSWTNWNLSFGVSYFIFKNKS